MSFPTAPSKRQRVSVDTYVPTNGSTQETTTAVQSHPTTPTRRASYLSPTKSSLARSHPDILSKSPGRKSLTEPRGRALRDELLGKHDRETGHEDITAPRTALRPTRKHSHRPEHNGVADQSRAEAQNLATIIARSFENAANDKRPRASMSPDKSRSPLRVRQPFGNIDSRRYSTGVENEPVQLIRPKLVNISGTASRGRSKSKSAEPELPPTPVQLGLGPAPDKPRGLPSSSSGGPQSGSGKNRRRVRSGTGGITSSPLKPRATERTLMPGTRESDHEDEDAAEAPESDVEDDRENVVQEVVSLEVQNKQDELAALRAELEQSQRELETLSTLTDELSKNSNLDIDEEAITLLLAGFDGQIEQPGGLNSHPKFIKNPTKYLTLFSPGNLNLSHTTSTTRQGDRTKITHRLTVNAPSPWPASALHLSFDVTVDAADARVEALTQAPANQQYKPHSTLQKWINSRLNDPIHKLDISSLIYGAGQIFNSSIQRARILNQLNSKYNHPPQDKHSNTKPITAIQEPIHLMSYLETSEMTFTSPSSSSSSTKSHIPKQILLTYNLTFSWTGEVTPRIEISINGVSSKASKGAKELFGKLLGLNGVERAFDAVWDVLGFSSGEGSNV